jgi:pyruvate dehydrogenase E1 component
VNQTGRVWAFLRRRRDGRAGVARRDQPGRTRAARQPHLRHQLQPAAARRPGARQRQDHPGARGRLPRRRLERHQGHLGRQLGSAARGRHRRRARRAHGEAVDGEYQKYTVETGAYIREHFFGTDPRPAALVENLSDEELRSCGAAGTIPRRSTPPTAAATEHEGRRRSSSPRRSRATAWARPARARTSPTSRRSSTKTSCGSSATASASPSPTTRSAEAPFYRPPEDSPEVKYLRERREALGGPLPARVVRRPSRSIRRSRSLRGVPRGSGGREVSTTMASCASSRSCCATRGSASASCRSCPTRPARSAWNRCSGSGHLQPTLGQLYEPVDARPALLQGGEERADPRGGHHRGRLDVLVDRRGHGLLLARPGMIPFYIFYSMFGFQRIGDLVWARRRHALQAAS